MNPPKNMVALNDCVAGHVYILRARNFALGVFDGKDGFVGLRYKHGSTFLATEYHWDTVEHQPHGTACPTEYTGIVAPEGMQLVERIPGTIDDTTKRRILFSHDPGYPDIRNWRYEDTGEICPDAATMSIYNPDLHAFLVNALKEPYPGCWEDGRKEQQK